MELERTGLKGRQKIELYAHSPNECDAFTDPRFPVSVTARFTLTREQWKDLTVNNINDFIPQLPFKVKLDKVNVHVETMLGDRHKWLIVVYLCTSEQLGKKIYESLEKVLF